MNFNIKTDIKTALAWGHPSSDGYGYSHIEYLRLLRDCLQRIEYLEQTLEDHSVLFTQTDFRNTASH